MLSHSDPEGLFLSLITVYTAVGYYPFILAVYLSGAC